MTDTDRFSEWFEITGAAHWTNRAPKRGDSFDTADPLGHAGALFTTVRDTVKDYEAAVADAEKKYSEQGFREALPGLVKEYRAKLDKLNAPLAQIKSKREKLYSKLKLERPAPDVIGELRQQEIRRMILGNEEMAKNSIEFSGGGLRPIAELYEDALLSGDLTVAAAIEGMPSIAPSWSRLNEGEVANAELARARIIDPQTADRVQDLDTALHDLETFAGGLADELAEQDNKNADQDQRLIESVYQQIGRELPEELRPNGAA